MHPKEAKTGDELYVALAQSREEGVFVRISTLIDMVGLDRAKTLVPITEFQSINRRRALELARLHKAEQLLTPEQRELLLPREAIGEQADSDP